LLEGRNLRPIAHAIASYSCASVEAFDPNKRDEPADPEAPFIERIRFYITAPDLPAAAIEPNRADALKADRSHCHGSVIAAARS
jgi:hypothetical protein